MRGDERFQDGMFSYVSLEQRVPQDHPLRGIRKLTDVVLASLDAEFDKLYNASQGSSIAPEYILRALLLQVFYSVRSDRLLTSDVAQQFFAEVNLRAKKFMSDRSEERRVGRECR